MALADQATVEPGSVPATAKPPAPEEAAVEKGLGQDGAAVETMSKEVSVPSQKPADPKSKPSFKLNLIDEPTKEILVPVAMVVGSSVFSYFAGRLRMGVVYALLFGGGVAYAIQTLKDRLTKAARIHAERSAQRKRVITDDESVEWLNGTLYRFWAFYEPVLCENIRAAVQPQLDQLKPPMLTGIELGRFTLGKRPPFISRARFLTKDSRQNPISEDKIVLNLGLGFHAPDLEVVVRANTAVASLPLCVKELWFEGKLRIEVELVPEFPHAKTAIVTFLEKPIVDFNIVPLKSVNVFDIPGLSQWLTSTIMGAINDNMVDPEKLVIDLMPPEKGHIDAARGVLFVTVVDAAYKETSAVDFGLTAQELFVEVKIGKEKAFTTHITAKGSADTFPFNDTISLLCTGNIAGETVGIYLKQKRMSVEKLLGKVYIPVADIANSPDLTLTEKLEFEASPGSINLKVVFHPLANMGLDAPPKEGQAGEGEKVKAQAEAQKGDDLEKLGVHTPEESTLSGTKAGALLWRLHEARDLPAKDSNGFSDPYCELYYLDELLAKTPVFEKNLNPVFDFNKEMTVGDIDKVRLTLRVFDKDPLMSDNIGDLDIDLQEILHVNGGDARKKVYRVDRMWLPLRKPGPPLPESSRTVTDVKKNGKASVSKSYGHVCLSFIFRPVSVPTDVKEFRADIANAGDDMSLSPWNKRKATGVVSKGLGTLTSGVGVVGSGIGVVGSGLTSGVVKMGSGLGSGLNVVGSGITSGVSVLGSGVEAVGSTFTGGATGATSLMGRGGSAVSQNMTGVKASQGRGGMRFFRKRSSDKAGGSSSEHDSGRPSHSEDPKDGGM